MNKWIGWVTAAAIAVASAGASSAPAASASGAPAMRCAFNLPLPPAACARLMHSRGQGPHRSWMSPLAGKSLLYVSQPLANAVGILSVSKKGLAPAGEIAVGPGEYPLGVTVDASKKLYVAAATLGSGTPAVYVYKRGATKPKQIYTKGLTQPLDVAVDGAGTLYVANESGQPCESGHNGGDVVEYAAGSKAPTATITDIPGCPNGIALDASGDLYVTYFLYPSSGLLQSDVIEYAPGSTSGTALGLKVPFGAFLYRPAIDAHGNLVVANIQADDTLEQILIFEGGSKAPTKTIQAGPGWMPEFFTLGGGHLFTGCYESVPLANEPAEFDYPSGRERFVLSPKQWAVGLSYAMAFSP